MAKLQENKRKFADPAPGFGGESPMRLPKDGLKPLFAQSGQLWRGGADRFPALRQWSTKKPETLQPTRTVQIVWAWGIDGVAGCLGGWRLMIGGNAFHA